MKKDEEFKRGLTVREKIKKLTAMDQLNLELECTGYLKDLVDYANKHMLKSFRLRLVMEEV